MKQPMTDFLRALSRYQKEYGEEPRVQMSEWFYRGASGKVSYLDIEVTDEVDDWRINEPGRTFCCGAYSSEAGCCPF